MPHSTMKKERLRVCTVPYFWVILPLHHFFPLVFLALMKLLSHHPAISTPIHFPSHLSFSSSATFFSFLFSSQLHAAWCTTQSNFPFLSCQALAWACSWEYNKQPARSISKNRWSQLVIWWCLLSIVTSSIGKEKERMFPMLLWFGNRWAVLLQEELMIF